MKLALDIVSFYYASPTAQATTALVMVLVTLPLTTNYKYSSHQCIHLALVCDLPNDKNIIGFIIQIIP